MDHGGPASRIVVADVDCDYAALDVDVVGVAEVVAQHFVAALRWLPTECDSVGLH